MGDKILNFTFCGVWVKQNGCFGGRVVLAIRSFFVFFFFFFCFFFFFVVFFFLCHFQNWLFRCVKGRGGVFQNSRYFFDIVRIGVRIFCWTDSCFFFSNNSIITAVHQFNAIEVKNRATVGHCLKHVYYWDNYYTGKINENHTFIKRKTRGIHIFRYANICRFFFFFFFFFFFVGGGVRVGEKAGWGGRLLADIPYIVLG